MGIQFSQMMMMIIKYTKMLKTIIKYARLVTIFKHRIVGMFLQLQHVSKKKPQ